MKRFASILFLFALVLAACSDGGSGLGASGDTAATVNGTVITVGEVENLVNESEDVIDKTGFARYLGAAIQIEIMERAAEADYGIVIPEADLGKEADRIFADNAQPDQSREDFLFGAGISETMLTEIALQQLIIAALESELTAEPTTEQLDEARQQAEWAAAEVCAAHILVDTEEEAADVLDRLESGEEFGVVASEVSTDTVSGEDGGDLGCSPPAGYVEPFALTAMTVDLDTPSEPVESQFGYHVILVTERTEADPDDIPSDEELVEQLEPALLDEAFTTWFLSIMDAADVVVAEEFGTWSTDPRPQVIAPATDTTGQPQGPGTTVQ